MATPRKRSTSQGFSSAEEEQQPVETTPVEETPDSTLQKMFETFSHIVEAPPQIIEEIVPTEDPGPRFVEPAAPSPAPAPAPSPQPVAPKRHPRNIPKFSRTK
jgi:hypothetical protein